MALSLNPFVITALPMLMYCIYTPLRKNSYSSILNEIFPATGLCSVGAKLATLIRRTLCFSFQTPLRKNSYSSILNEIIRTKGLRAVEQKEIFRPKKSLYPT